MIFKFILNHILLLQLYSFHLDIYYVQFCQTSLSLKNTFQKTAASLKIPFNTYDSNETKILLHKNNIIQQYEWDSYYAEYWLNLFFYEKLPTFNTTLTTLNQIHENILILYGNEQHYLDFLKQAYNLPIYYLIYAKNINNQLHKTLFIQENKSNESYIYIRRSQDRYDNLMKLTSQFQQQFNQFISLYGQPYSQQYFTMQTIKYLQLNPQLQCYIYISLNLYQFKQQTQIVKQISEEYRNKNHLFIITKPILQAKTLLQRFLYKDIKNGPYLIQIKFNPFQFLVFEEQEWNKFNIKQWINKKQNLILHYHFISQLPYTYLSYQDINKPFNNKIHNINLLQKLQTYAKLNNEQIPITILTLVPNCFDSFKLFAKYSKIQTNRTLLYSINTFNNYSSNQVIEMNIN